MAWRERIKKGASGRSKMDSLKERDKLRELAEESKRGRGGRIEEASLRRIAA